MARERDLNIPGYGSVVAMGGVGGQETQGRGLTGWLWDHRRAIGLAGLSAAEASFLLVKGAEMFANNPWLGEWYGVVARAGVVLTVATGGGLAMKAKMDFDRRTSRMSEWRERGKVWLGQVEKELLEARNEAAIEAMTEVRNSLGGVAGDPRLQKPIEQVAHLRVAGRSDAAEKKLREEARRIREGDN